MVPVRELLRASDRDTVEFCPGGAVGLKDVVITFGVDFRMRARYRRLTDDDPASRISTDRKNVGCQRICATLEFVDEIALR